MKIPSFRKLKMMFSGSMHDYHATSMDLSVSGLGFVETLQEDRGFAVYGIGYFPFGTTMDYITTSLLRIDSLYPATICFDPDTL